MGKYDLAIKFGKSLLSDTANYVKACGKRSILETKPPIFHGINPTLTYAPSGKSFALPRFCTEEMKQARQMNKIAIRQAKAGEVVRTYPKATPQDLKRLTSETIEDSYSRVTWTNPKDGKVYSLLKQGETEDGKVIVRILDEVGAFIKEAKLTPKKIKIYDSDNSKVDLGKYYEEISHGEVVTRFTRRANPFADIEYINIDHTREQNTIFNCYNNLADEYKKLHKSLIEGDKVDYISLSIGLNPNIVPPKGLLEKAGKTLFEYKTTVDTFPTSQLIKYHPNLRVLQASSNAGKDVISPDLMFKGIEGVGALGRDGKIADFSASRSSILTQHYEQGVFQKHPTKYGLGYFDAHSTDITLKPEYLESASKYLGKKPQVIGAELTKRMNGLKNIARKKYETELKRIRAQVVTPEEENQLEKLRQTMRRETNPIKQKTAQDEYWEYHRKLYKKTTEALKNYENPEGIEYKRFIEYAEENGLVYYSPFWGGQYKTFEKTPYITDYDTFTFIEDKNGNLILGGIDRIFPLQGTSFSTPIRTAKLALNDMMEGIL